MISIKQKQKKIIFDTIQFQEKAQKILDHLDYGDFDLGILLTTDETMRVYNRQYRGKDAPTDVLSFPYHADLKAGQRIEVFVVDDKNLGDIIISLPYVFENRHQLDGSFEQRMDRMLVHAIGHLLGYDHIDDDDYLKMDAFEKELLRIIQ